jgi:hypothetical protein
LPYAPSPLQKKSDFINVSISFPNQTVPPEGTGDNDGLGVEAAATALAAADTLHAALHKYSAALASVLSKDERDHACGVALAGFLAAFPPPGRAPASGAAVPKSPNTSPTVAERTQDPVVKKKGGLGGFSAAGTFVLV